jgi:hypothetical protein
MALLENKPKKIKQTTKADNIEKHAKVLFAEMMNECVVNISSQPKNAAFNEQTIKEMLIRRAKTAITAAEMFDRAWEANKGKFIEDKAD